MAPTNDEKNITDIKEMLEEAQQKANRAEVQEEFLLKQLKENFDVDSIEEGEELIKQLTDEAEEVKAETREMLDSLVKRLEKDGLL